MTDRPQDNSGQATFWSDTVGHHWVREVDALDAQHAPVLDAVLDQAALRPGARVLDIGCGAGTSTARAGAITGPTGRAAGLDISTVLLDAARARHGDQPGVDFLLADAQTHRFEPQSYDALISRFGVMFFADTTAAFANIARSLRPGARLVMAAWGPARNNPYFLRASRAAQDVLGDVPPTDRTLPGPFAWEDRDRTIARLQAAGLDGVAVTAVHTMLTPPGTLDSFARLCTHIGPAHSVLRQKEATQDQTAQVVTALRAAYAEFDTPRGLHIPADISIYSARVPG